MASVPERDEEGSVGAEHQSAAPMLARACLRLLAPDRLRVLEPALAEPPTRHRGAGAALARLGEREVDEPVLSEAGAQRDVEQAALAAGADFRERQRAGPTARRCGPRSAAVPAARSRACGRREGTRGPRGGRVPARRPPAAWEPAVRRVRRARCLLSEGRNHQQHERRERGEQEGAPGHAHHGPYGMPRL